MHHQYCNYPNRLPRPITFSIIDFSHIKHRPTHSVSTTMATSKVKKTGRKHQRITHTACEPCRDKRAKCDGQKPCGRCQGRGLECHFIQRAWASKRSLQDETATLREKLRRRDCVLEALSVPGSGDDIVRMLRQSDTTIDQVFKNLGEGSRIPPNDDADMKLDLGDQRNSGPCDREGRWSPSTASTNLFSELSQGHSPISSAKNGTFTDDGASQPSTISLSSTTSDQQQQSVVMQAIPWASLGATSFGTIFDSTTPINLNLDSCSSIIDPLFWPPSDPLGQPMLNSWTGLMSDVNSDVNNEVDFPCVA
ncbi:hypothetical protein F5883DRAFT_572751 [Diaporthe sp. PMI_573]|nr:hypothetical protein F5883DRAFT_572751 [Diaporthaceae sp. PMI_573]